MYGIRIKYFWNPFLLILLFATLILAQDAWVEDSYEDFRDGTFTDAGSNLYVSSKGRMQMITRWDFNNDGNLDIFLPGSHGHTEKENIFIYLNKGNDIDGRSRIELPAAGASDGLVADFNKDGFNDLGVIHYSDSHFKRVPAWIYMGSKDGFSVEDRIELPSAEGSAMVYGDFNNDSWLDIAIACQFWDEFEDKTKEDRKSFIYWNSKEGFKSNNRLEISFDGSGLRELVAGDVDNDQITDLIGMADKSTYIFLSSRSAFSKIENAIKVDLNAKSASIGNINGNNLADVAFCLKGEIVLFKDIYNETISLNNKIFRKISNPVDIALEDLNNDGLDEIVVANFSTVGGATWTDSFIFSVLDGKIVEKDKLKTIGASAVTCSDLNNDNMPDLIFSFERVTNQKNLLSYIYWNDNGSFRYENHTQLPTLGTMANAVGDVNNDGLKDVIYFNDEGYFRDGPTESPIYWGDGTKNFNLLRKYVFQTHQIFGFGHADLDDDSYVDMIFAQKNFIYGVNHEQGGVIIHWGNGGTFDPPTHLTMEYAYGGVRVADINRDGYLDILAGGYATDQTNPTIHGFPIFWGSEDGYSFKNRQLLHYAGKRFRVPLLMDLNKDDWLDIAGQVEDGKVRIWWGNQEGFIDKRFSDIDLGRKDHLMYIKGADLNKDGWLDLIFPQRGSPDGTRSSSFIYYGSSNGFNNDNRVEVYSFVPYQNTIADLNNDEWLDLLLTSYGGEVSGNRPSLIYWGSQKGFSKNPAELETYGSSGSEALDYNNDGWLDLMISNHRRAGSYLFAEPHKHITPQLLYWGSANGYSKHNRTEITAVGTSGQNVRDAGNSYDRGLYEDYISSPYQINDDKLPVKIEWDADTPYGTSVKFQLRFSNILNEIESSDWYGAEGKSSWYTNNKSMIAPMEGKYIQYRVRLMTPNGAATPYLKKVKIIFE